MLEATGERVVPELQGEELVLAEHVARYRFAAQFGRGRRVLDAASGEGYGTAMLREAGALEVVGVDVDEAAVHHARERYGPVFERADVAELPFADSSFDLVVSFETIEHVPDAHRALAELRRVLAPEGLLVISTPNADEYRVENSFHTREWPPDEFLELLEGYFRVGERRYQQNWLLSAVLHEADFRRGEPGAALDLEVEKLAGRTPGTELYSVVVCGPEVPAVRQTAAITSVYEAHRMAEALGSAQRTLGEWITRADGAERLLGEWQARAQEAERLLGEWQGRASEAERQLAEARNALERIRSSTSWRLTGPLRRLGERARARRGAG